VLPYFSFRVWPHVQFSCLASHPQELSSSFDAAQKGPVAARKA
jgi:hypothetical protein